jgi:hypothetical protein
MLPESTVNGLYPMIEAALFGSILDWYIRKKEHATVSISTTVTMLFIHFNAVFIRDLLRLFS